MFLVEFSQKSFQYIHLYLFIYCRFTVNYTCADMKNLKKILQKSLCTTDNRVDCWNLSQCQYNELYTYLQRRKVSFCNFKQFVEKLHVQFFHMSCTDYPCPILFHVHSQLFNQLWIDHFEQGNLESLVN
jgi:hypothetical protein